MRPGMGGDTLTNHDAGDDERWDCSPRTAQPDGEGGTTLQAG